MKEAYFVLLSRKYSRHAGRRPVTKADFLASPALILTGEHLHNRDDFKSSGEVEEKAIGASGLKYLRKVT
jgi:hypothetical protein